MSRLHAVWIFLAVMLHANGWKMAGTPNPAKQDETDIRYWPKVSKYWNSHQPVAAVTRDKCIDNAPSSIQAGLGKGRETLRK
jgi:hypothetical protein